MIHMRKGIPGERLRIKSKDYGGKDDLIEIRRAEEKMTNYK